MNIQEWKKFSDAVDEANNRLFKALISEEKDLIEYGFMPHLMKKTEVNFWEWKAGKLKLDNN